jgi:hypothetical protein
MVMKKMLFWSFIGLFVLSVFTACEQEIPPDDHMWTGTTWERHDTTGALLDTITLGKSTLRYRSIQTGKEETLSEYGLAPQENNCTATVAPDEAIRDWLVIDDPDPYLAIIYSTIDNQNKPKTKFMGTPKLMILHPILYSKVDNGPPYIYTLK